MHTEYALVPDNDSRIWTLHFYVLPAPGQWTAEHTLRGSKRRTHAAISVLSAFLSAHDNARPVAVPERLFRMGFEHEYTASLWDAVLCSMGLAFLVRCHNE